MLPVALALNPDKEAPLARGFFILTLRLFGFELSRLQRSAALPQIACGPRIFDAILMFRARKAPAEERTERVDL
ncbi:MAG: hypothetical protein NVS1B14_06360 [Vulcanimicrobiaceae bacterium]